MALNFKRTFKIALLLTNALILILIAIVLVFAVMGTISTHYMFYITIFIIVISLFLIALIILSIWASVKEHVRGLAFYAALMLISIILNCVVLAILHIATKKILLLDDMLSLDHNRDIELELECCGIYGFKDYTDQSLKVPSSCCGLKDVKAACNSHTYSHRTGCRVLIVGWEHYLFQPLKILFVLILISVIIAIIVACLFAYIIYRDL